MNSPDPPNPATSLARRDDPRLADRFDDLAMQSLWLAIRRRAWRSLAVVAGSPHAPTIEVASTLAKLCWAYRGQPTYVVDRRDLSLRLIEYQLREVASQLEQQQLTIIALRSIAENPTVVPVAASADAVVLCVRLGQTKIAAAERTVNEIGRDKFIGTIVLHDPVRRRK